MNQPSQIISSPSLSPAQQRIQDAIARFKAVQAAKSQTNQASQATIETVPESISAAKSMVLASAITSGIDATDRFGNSITYNTNQQSAIDLISSGQSCVVVGAAGTGKTTIQKGSTQALIQSGRLQRIKNSGGHKHLQIGSYGIAICAYTRRATNNIRKNLSEDLQQSCLTIHKLLEYQPTEVETTLEDGTTKQSMRFLPSRGRGNPLPQDLQVIVIEEASMVSIELFQEILDALDHEVQFVFLGDIQQLPPVFGSAILGYKMLELPVVELTEVYRQALDSPIISLAHRILSGRPIEEKEFNELNVPGKLKLHPWQKKISPEAATATLAKFFLRALDQGVYNPSTDGILIPFNKSCGTLELNNHIASAIAKKEFKAVYEIIHGFKKSYYSVGDKCLYEREDAIIEGIEWNAKYTGIKPKEASPDLDYWGHISGDTRTTEEMSEDDVDQLLAAVSVNLTDEDGDKVREASHEITLRLIDSDRVVVLHSAGEVDALILGYAITVHKSQGSEWQKVFLCFHHSHATMIQRELIYTAVTRARVELYCICEPDTFVKGIKNQRIQGSSWQDKAQFFQGKIDRKELQSKLEDV